MARGKEAAAATRKQPARQVKRALVKTERAPAGNSPRKQPAHQAKRKISTTDAIRRIKREESEVSTTESNVIRRDLTVANVTRRDLTESNVIRQDLTVANITTRNLQGKYLD